MGPKAHLEKQAWLWAETTSPENVEQTHLESAYRIKLKCCQPGTCKRNCKGNPNCLYALGERDWLFDKNVISSNDIDDPEADKKSPDNFVGLKNLGATCYVNCLLQLWYHNPALRKAIYQWNPYDDPKEVQNLKSNPEKSYVPLSIVGHLQYVFGLLQYSHRRFIDPSELIKSIGLNTDQQQDAQEFSKLFMNHLEDKLQHQNDAHVRGIVQSHFRGEYSYTTTCLKCNHQSTRPSTFYELDLNIMDHTELGECIEEFLHEEKLDGDDCYYCSQCKCKQTAVRKIKLGQMPPVLNLQLLRFIFDRKSGHKKKLTSFITFPEVLNMGKYMGLNDDTSCIYDLVAVLIHEGATAYAGHYIAHIKDKATNIWYRFNDENVEKVSGKNLGSTAEDKGRGKPPKKPKVLKGHHYSQSAYMIVYTRRTTEIIDVPKDNTIEWGLPDRVKRLIIMDNITFSDWIADLKRMRAENVQKGKNKQSQIRELYRLMHAMDESVYDWVKTEWLSQWLAAEDNVKKVDNSSVLCPHSKLHPDNVTQMKCISQKAADIIFSKYGGGPRLNNESLCKECVVARCHLIRMKAKIIEDSKYISQMKKNKQNLEDGGFWVGRSSLRSWNKLVLEKYLDNDDKDDNDGQDGSTDSDDSVTQRSFNDEILCEHKKLEIHENSRQVVSRKVWDRLKEYFPDAPEFSQDVLPCDACQNLEAGANEKRERNRTYATTQRQILCDLYYDRNRPVTGTIACGKILNIINSTFVEDWRKFTKDSARRNPPEKVDNNELLCEHNGLRYQPDHKSMKFLWSDEWSHIRKWYEVDQDITVICRCLEGDISSTHPSFFTSPEVCLQCCMDEKGTVEYKNAKIYVRKLERKPENLDSDELSEGNQTSGKKRKIEDTDDGVQLLSECNVRRSSRHRRLRGEREFCVSSSQTLKELRVQIMKEFAVAPFDQHLSLNGVAVTDNSSTLLSLRIFPGSCLLLKADESSDQNILVEDYCKEVVPEEGFKGTELQGS